MRWRLWLPCVLLLLGLIGGAGLWSYPLTVRSGAATLATGPGSFAHDGYVSIPAGALVIGLALVGLVLFLVLHGRRDTV